MLELSMLAAGFAGGYVASIYSWPMVKIAFNGLSGEAVSLRTKAAQLERKIDQIRGAL